MEAIVTYTKKNIIDNLRKTTTVAIAFTNVVSLASFNFVFPIHDKHETSNPSFDAKLINHMASPISTTPTFTVSKNSLNSKELNAVGQKHRVKIPLREEKYNVASFSNVSEEILDFERENPTIDIVRERIKIPFRHEVENKVIGSEFV